jgi:hypothetical protein
MTAKQDHTNGRVCNKCRTLKLADAFFVHIRDDGSFRLRSICKACGSCMKTERTEPTRCPGCKLIKPPEAFGGSIRVRYCRVCANERSYAHKRGAGRAAHNARMSTYQKEKHATDPVYRMKVSARSAVRAALEKGVLTKPLICSSCNRESRVTAHHHNGYDKEHRLDIVWICARCHRAEDFPDDPVRIVEATIKKETEMEKYAVEEGVNQEELEKQAMHGCPKCGGRVDRHGKVLTCANCGTEPFEAEKA